MSLVSLPSGRSHSNWFRVAYCRAHKLCQPECVRPNRSLLHHSHSLGIWSVHVLTTSFTRKHYAPFIHNRRLVSPPPSSSSSGSTMTETRWRVLPIFFGNCSLRASPVNRHVRGHLCEYVCSTNNGRTREYAADIMLKIYTTFAMYCWIAVFFGIFRKIVFF